MAGGRFELAMKPTAIGLVSLSSNSETHMTAICDARLIVNEPRSHHLNTRWDQSIFKSNVESDILV